MIQYFKIADFPFAVCSETDVTSLLTNLLPFVCEGVDERQLLFTLTLDGAVNENRSVFYRSEEYDFSMAKADGLYSIEFTDVSDGRNFIMEFDGDFRNFRTNMCSNRLSGVLDNMLMLAYTFASAGCNALLVHASVVVVDGKAYMFLGKSGTGKSTHAGLWLKYIDGAVHLNDDNPVLKFSDGKVYACGSAWSGKGRIYKNEVYEVGGIVRLAQAPYNRIERRTGAKAFALVYTSCSKLPWSEQCMKNVCSTLGKVVGVAPVYYLECLPDRDAALLSFNTMKQL